MPKLIVEQPGVPPMSVDLTEPETSFGRDPDNTIVLIADEISRHHSVIRLVKEKTYLNDLKSLNGTYVNRQRIMERVLNDGDEVWFGSKCRGIFKDDTDTILEQRRRESSMTQELAKIKNEMDNVTAAMTMIVATPSDVDADEEQPPATPIPQGMDVDKLGRAFRRLDALYKTTQLFSTDFDLQERISEVLDLAMEVMRADRGFLMMRDEDSDTLKVQVIRDSSGKISSSSPSMGIARKAAIDGDPVLMSDSDLDSKYGQRESIIMQRIETAMCVPLQIHDEIIGSLYVDSKSELNNFNEEDLEMFQAIANQAAMAIHNVRLHQRMVDAEKKRADLGRFLSPAIVKTIMDQKQELQLGGDKITATVLYCDIRGFTPLSEGLTPDVLVGLLNEHFTAMTEIVFKYKGTLDKFIGDEVMALFGAPFPMEEDALLAVRAAIEMQQRNEWLNESRLEQKLPTFEIGIGINSGDVFSGYIGSPDRMDYTVIGDNVNVASRLCSVASAGEIIIGEATQAMIQGLIETEPAGTPILKGKSQVIQTHRVIR
jgi:adenylate cyclase